jgi:putative ABC transport system substrate-binding protein
MPSASHFATRAEALRAGLREFGYVEGKNTLVAGLSRPGGNITGSTYFAPELAAKQLELLKEAFPQTTRVAVVVNPSNPAMGPTLQAVESAARSLKLELEQFAVREPPDFAGAFVTIAKKRCKTALIIDDPITISSARALADLAVKHRLAPAGYIQYAEAGGLMAYGVNLVAMWRRAAFLWTRFSKAPVPGRFRWSARRDSISSSTAKRPKGFRLPFHHRYSCAPTG